MMLLDEVEAAIEHEPTTRPSRPWFLLGLLVCGLLIFAHFGCHGDDDHELFVRLVPARPGSANRG